MAHVLSVNGPWLILFFVPTAPSVCWAAVRCRSHALTPLAVAESHFVIPLPSSLPSMTWDDLLGDIFLERPTAPVPWGLLGRVCAPVLILVWMVQGVVLGSQ